MNFITSPVLKAHRPPVLFFWALCILNSAWMTLVCLVQNGQCTLSSRIGTLVRQGGFSCWLIASAGSPSTHPKPVIPTAHSTPVVSFAVLHSKKKTFIYYMFSRLDSMEVGPVSLGVNMGYGISERNWQRNPLIHHFRFCFSALFLNLCHFGWKEKGAFSGTRQICLFDWGTSSFVPL